jgi:hypothetical protein
MNGNSQHALGYLLSDHSTYSRQYGKATKLQTVTMFRVGDWELAIGSLTFRLGLSHFLTSETKNKV